MGKWDFDPDELFFFVLAAIIGIGGAFVWYLRILTVRNLAGQGSRSRLLLALTPPLNLIALVLVLQRWSDPQYVVGQLDYILMFACGGAMWLWFGKAFSALMGISARDDALERGNLAAAIAVCGALISAMAVYAWCNVGAGPTIWTTIFPAAVATAALFLLWWIVEAIAHISDSIAIDRDVASAFRLAAGLIAMGLILGRGMAGDWTSWTGTFSEFVRVGWPAIMVAIALVVLQMIFRPTPTQPRPPVFAAGFWPALAILAVATLYIFAQGKPDIGVHVITYEQYMGKEARR